MTAFLQFTQSSKLSSVFNYLLLLFLPTQLGKHFWPQFAFIFGQRIDYLSPTLYATDLIAFFCIFFGLRKKRINYNLIFKIAIIFLFLATGVFISRNPYEGWLKLVKLLEFILLGFVLKDFFSKSNMVPLTIVFSIGVVFESLLSFWQFSNQGSIGSFFYFLGERTFNGTSPGIANAVINNTLVLRPYGTFSHPNVLAGYLLIFSIFILFTLPKITFLRRRLIMLLAITIATLAIFLTLSRLVILLWILTLFVKSGIFLKKNKKFLLISFLMVSSSFLLLLKLEILQKVYFRFSSLTFLDESFHLRIALVNKSFQIIKANILFGVGFGNFFNALSLYPSNQDRVLLIQPVHNVFLIILSETGIIGIFFLFWFLFKTFKEVLKNKDNQSLKMILLIIVVLISMLDHYLFTLQQGQLLLVIALAFCRSEEKPKFATIQK